MTRVYWLFFIFLWEDLSISIVKKFRCLTATNSCRFCLWRYVGAFRVLLWHSLTMCLTSTARCVQNSCSLACCRFSACLCVPQMASDAATGESAARAMRITLSVMLHHRVSVGLASLPTWLLTHCSQVQIGHVPCGSSHRAFERGEVWQVSVVGTIERKHYRLHCSV